MSYVLNNERSFKEDAIEGLAAAYQRFLRRVPGTFAVASVNAPEPGRVSTIIGGGSGHYPAFAGLVGPGLADAAVCGDVFTSPSAEQAYRTIRAVDGGAGVLMMFGNYAGDVMHFGLAAEHAKESDGIDARIVLVTDDIASAPPERATERRGIAGGFFVFRAAAAAAHRGDALGEVERIARRMNAATRTIGAAFEGCTVPGREEPLFHIEDDKMEIGLGIHGEPGILTVPRANASDLAQILTSRLLAERPDGAERARVLVNGLGRVKYEELFVLHRSVAVELTRAGVRLIEPEVGEFVTSLDMAGCSVTLGWTDDELEELLSRPATTPGYVRAGGGLHEVSIPRQLGAIDSADLADANARANAVTKSGKTAREALSLTATRLRELERQLGDLDAVAADGDHGTTMTRGIDAALQAAMAAGPGASEVLTAAGMAFADAAGGASGALWGSALTTIGNGLAGNAECPSATRLAELWRAAEASVVRLGGAALGEKTMLDALHPFVATFAEAAESGVGLADAWMKAAEASVMAANESANLVPKRGRASKLPERSLGHIDPGALSLAQSLLAASSAFRSVAQ